jgi:hypothetical protein
VRFRWEEFSPPERREFANYTVNLITEVVGPTEEWALKSQTAALVAEVTSHPLFVSVYRSVFLMHLVQRCYSSGCYPKNCSHICYWT